MKKLIAIIVAMVTSSGMLACTIYKSSDRDSFNSNAKAGAPSVSVTNSQTLSKPHCYPRSEPVKESDLSPTLTAVDETHTTISLSFQIDAQPMDCDGLVTHGENENHFTSRQILDWSEALSLEAAHVRQTANESATE